MSLQRLSIGDLMACKPLLDVHTHPDKTVVSTKMIEPCNDCCEDGTLHGVVSAKDNSTASESELCTGETVNWLDYLD